MVHVRVPARLAPGSSVLLMHTLEEQQSLLSSVRNIFCSQNCFLGILFLSIYISFVDDCGLVNIRGFRKYFLMCTESISNGV